MGNSLVAPSPIGPTAALGATSSSTEELFHQHNNGGLRRLKKKEVVRDTAMIFPTPIFFQRPALSARCSSLSEFKVGTNPALIARIGRYLNPAHVRRVRKVCRHWYNALDGVVRSHELTVVLMAQHVTTRVKMSLVGTYRTADDGNEMMTFAPTEAISIDDAGSGIDVIRVLMPLKLPPPKLFLPQPSFKRSSSLMNSLNLNECPRSVVPKTLELSESTISHSEDIIIDNPALSWIRKSRCYGRNGDVCTTNHCILQLDRTNLFIKELCIPLNSSIVKNIFSLQNEAMKVFDATSSRDDSSIMDLKESFIVSDISARLSPAVSTELYPPHMFSHQRLRTILSCFSNLPADSLARHHLPPASSAAMRNVLSCRLEHMDLAFYPIFVDAAGGEDFLMDFIRLWEATSKRVQILTAFDDAVVARSVATNGSMRKWRKGENAAVPDWVIASIKDVTGNIVDQVAVLQPKFSLDGSDSVKAQARNRATKILQYCGEAVAAFFSVPGAKCYFILTGGLFDSNAWDQFCHISDVIIPVLSNR